MFETTVSLSIATSADKLLSHALNLMKWLQFLEGNTLWSGVIIQENVQSFNMSASWQRVPEGFVSQKQRVDKRAIVSVTPADQEVEVSHLYLHSELFHLEMKKHFICSAE